MINNDLNENNSTNSSENNHQDDNISSNDIKIDSQNNPDSESNKDNQQEQIDFSEIKKNYEETINDLQDKLIRSIAETENTRKRYEKQISDLRDYSVVQLIKEIVPALDNLTRALEFKHENLTENEKNVLMGVEMTYSEVMNILSKYGVQKIEPEIGEKFDYNLHHAISQIQDSNFEPGHVVNIIQLGYKIKDRLIRPSLVTVSKS